MRSRPAIDLPALGFSLVALVTSCSEPAPDSGRPGPWQAQVDTVGDTVVVRTLSGSVWGDTADLIPELVIGVLDGPDEYIFGDVSAMAVTEDHHVYVMDQQVPALRKYAPDGTHVADLGRKGGGPGEYKAPDGGLVILSDGRIVVRDPGNGRFTVFGPDDGFRETWRHPSGGGFNTSSPLYVDRQDNTYTLVITNLGVSVMEWEWSLTRIHADGEIGDTLLSPTWDYERPQVTGQSESRSSSTSVPFSPDIHWTWSPEGYYVGSLATEYRVDQFRHDAQMLRIEKDWAPVRVIPAEAAEQERGIRENFRSRFEGWRWNGPPIPDVKPPLTDLFVAPDGRIWVQVSQSGVVTLTEDEAQEAEELSGRPVMRYREPVAFDVFESDGRFLGHVKTPMGFSTGPTPVFRGDYVWAVVRDELDVTTVVRFRLRHRS